MLDSIFNKPVTSDAVLPGSAAEVANIVAQYQSAYGEIGVNFNRPVYYASASTPDVPVSVASGCNNFTSNTGTEVPIPSWANQGDSSDNILTVYQPSSNTVWEFWEAEPNTQSNATSWTACWGGKATLSTSSGVFPSNFGETASGISNLATEITEADLNSGSINHAIGMEVLSSDCDGSVAPADRTDCGSNVANAPSEGSYFRFAPGTAMPGGLTPFAQMVFKAISTYGMVVVDRGGAVMLEADQPNFTADGVNYIGPWQAEGEPAATDPIDTTTGTDAEYQLVANLPWASLQAIDPPQS
jgi:hypothetical protein